MKFLLLISLAFFFLAGTVFARTEVDENHNEEKIPQLHCAK